jgi:chemotaxis protein CheX
MSPADILLEEILKQSGQSSLKAASGDDKAVDFAKCVAESCRNVFSTMCAVELNEGVESVDSGLPDGHQVLSMIELSGGANAQIRLSASREIILEAATMALGDRPSDIDADVKDFVGELANMIGGNTKKQLGRADISLSLPRVESATDSNAPATCGVAIAWTTDTQSKSIEFAVAGA